jgi:hypothetical protein
LKRNESRKNTAGKVESLSLEVGVGELEEPAVGVVVLPAELLIKLNEQV